MSSEVEAATLLLQLRAGENDPEPRDREHNQVSLFPLHINIALVLTDDRMAGVLMSRRIGPHATAVAIDWVLSAHFIGRRVGNDALNEIRIEGRELWLGRTAVRLQGGCALTSSALRLLPHVRTLRVQLLQHRSKLVGDHS
ncbi:MULTISPECIES: hypothetical protein [unclassified Microbacterium]|uniref:hypothetical protein n=1 Tax=unclassified Microbacterium TaxID=2609290 RepID=UPI00109CBEB3|nr:MULTISPECIES: hypothetical protein [unclassified Microbacterium]NIG66750.1 hypothetical protein [Microbacterium sp. Be9]